MQTVLCFLSLTPLLILKMIKIGFGSSISFETSSKLMQLPLSEMILLFFCPIDRKASLKEWIACFRAHLTRTASVISKTTCTDNSNIPNWKVCFGKLPERLRKEISFNIFKQWRQSTLDVSTGSSIPRIQSTGQTCISKGSDMVTLHQILQRLSMRSFWQHERCLF